MVSKKAKLANDPLDIKCMDTKCDEGKHCFCRPGRSKSEKGACRDCGVRVIDWDRMHRRSRDDVSFVIDSLRTELIRDSYWTRPFDQKALKKGIPEDEALLEDLVSDRIIKSLGKKCSEIFRDGTQTEKSGDLIAYGQHAMAVCCRKCVECWHGVPKDQVLSNDDVAYLRSLVLTYLELRSVPRNEDYRDRRRRKFSSVEALYDQRA